MGRFRISDAKNKSVSWVTSIIAIRSKQISQSHPFHITYTFRRFKISRGIFFFCTGILLINLFLVSCYAQASAYLPVSDDTYEILSRLDAEGVIQSGLLTTKPLGRQEAVRLLLEAEKSSETSSPFIQNLIKSLREKLKDDIGATKFLKPVDSLYTSYLYADSDI